MEWEWYIVLVALGGTVAFVGVAMLSNITNALHEEGDKTREALDEHKRAMAKNTDRLESAIQLLRRDR